MQESAYRHHVLYRPSWRFNFSLRSNTKKGSYSETTTMCKPHSAGNFEHQTPNRFPTFHQHTGMYCRHTHAQHLCQDPYTLGREVSRLIHNYKAGKKKYKKVMLPRHHHRHHHQDGPWPRLRKAAKSFHFGSEARLLEVFLCGACQAGGQQPAVQTRHKMAFLRIHVSITHTAR